MPRQFCLSRVEFLQASFLCTSFLNPWGEDDPITAQLHDGSFDETESLNYWAFLASSAPRDALVLDVGAFAGLFSLVAAALRDDLKAVAFEASAVTFGRLVDNIVWNGFDLRVIPVNLAASAAAGSIVFPHAFGILTMSPGESIDATAQPDHTQTAAAIPLDLMLEPAGRLPDYLNSTAIPFGPLTAIAAIKIDVEGHEVSVLQGARVLIDTFRPAVICEALDVAAASALEVFFETVGYRAVPIAHERNIVFIPRERFEAVTLGYAEWQREHGHALNLRAKRILTYAP